MPIPTGGAVGVSFPIESACFVDIEKSYIGQCDIGHALSVSFGWNTRFQGQCYKPSSCRFVNSFNKSGTLSLFTDSL